MKSYKLTQYTRITDQTNHVALWVISAPGFDILKHGSRQTFHTGYTSASNLFLIDFWMYMRPE